MSKLQVLETNTIKFDHCKKREKVEFSYDNRKFPPMKLTLVSLLLLNIQSHL